MIVAGVGKVQILKKNNYSLEQGEPSVYEREYKPKIKPLAAAVSTETTVFIPRRGRQVAGRDFEHQEMCQVCATPLLCTILYHTSLHSVPESSICQIPLSIF